MTPTEMGLVFSMLVKHREIHGNPTRRALRDGELSAAHILAGCSPYELEGFEDFLNSQGLSLYIRNAFEFGIPPKYGRPNMIFVLTRKRNEELAPYISQSWFLDQMLDRRTNDTKTELLIWTTRLWLTLQWFFYQRIDRMPSDVVGMEGKGGFQSALVSETLFLDVLSQGVERLGNEGRPEGEKGLIWDVIWNGKKNLEGYASRFLRVMKVAGMIEDAGNVGEYRQTLVAAIDMSLIAEDELMYLMPAEFENEIDHRSVEMLVGEIIEPKIESEADADRTTN